MSFVRIFIGQTSGVIRHVIEQTVPFAGSGRMIHDTSENLEVADLGFAENIEWRDLAGNKCSPAQHFYERLKDTPRANVAAAIAARNDLPRLHDCPCTMDALKARLRAHGPSAIPAKARAWLANVLPWDEVKAMGLARGLPISTLKAAEAQRIGRDPDAGSRIEQYERIAQQQADARHASRLRRVRS